MHTVISVLLLVQVSPLMQLTRYRDIAVDYTFSHKVHFVGIELCSKSFIFLPMRAWKLSTITYTEQKSDTYKCKANQYNSQVDFDHIMFCIEKICVKSQFGENPRTINKSNA
jgi:hypothetical protein